MRIVRTRRVPARGFLGALALLICLVSVPKVLGAQEAAGTQEAAVPPRYTIRLERGAPSGTHFMLTAEARIFRSEAVVEDEEEIESEGSGEGRVRLEAAATVYEINKEGGITRAEYKVRSFEGSIDGNPVEEIPPGSILRTENEEQGTRITLVGGELSSRQMLLLVQVLETAQEDQPGDDDLFGTEEPQAMGSAWPIHAAAAVEAFSANGTELSAESVSGGSRLVEKHEIAGVECLKIEGRMDISYMKPPGIDETAFANARMTLEFQGDYPVDTALLAFEGKILSRLEIRHLLFGPEEEEDLPIYHLAVSESEKSFSIRPLKGTPQEEGPKIEESSEGSPSSAV